MSDKVLPKKKAGASTGRPETEDMSPRKRKGGRTADLRELSPHADRSTSNTVGRGAQGRTRSDLGPARPTERQHHHQRYPQTVPTHRRVSVDVHRAHKSNMSNPGLRAHRRVGAPPGPPRTMLQHAWHTVLNSDPLVDSDEDCPDEHLRLDYNRRMQVITRLRGRPPTPEAECSQVPSA